MNTSSVSFNPDHYVKEIEEASSYIKSKLPKDFIPKIVLTLGSGGLGEIAKSIEAVIPPIPYDDIPHFPKTTIVGHEGMLYAGYLQGVPVLGLKGRKHYYELGGQPNQVIALKHVVFPVYVMRSLGAVIYIATNAAGGLNATYKPGNLMLISSHNGIHFPNALLGPQVPLFDAWRFQPQHGEYDVSLRDLFLAAAKESNEEDYVHEGVYCAVTGPTFESKAESQMLRGEGCDAVGMSTVPEIIVATNIGMDTMGVSLITNVISKDGTNKTSHEEVMAALLDKKTQDRCIHVFSQFFLLYREKMLTK